MAVVILGARMVSKNPGGGVLKNALVCLGLRCIVNKVLKCRRSREVGSVTVARVEGEVRYF